MAATRTNKLLRDVITRHQVYLERLKAGEARKLDAALRELGVAVEAALRALDGTRSRRTLDATLVRLRRDAQATLGGYSGALEATLQALHKHAAGVHVQALGLVWPEAAPALVTPAAAASWAAVLRNPIQATGALLQPFLAQLAARAIVAMEGAVRVGVAQGTPTAEIVRQIVGTRAAKYADGLLQGLTRRQAEAVVRTSIQHVNASAQAAVLASNNVEKYIWVSTLDSRTSQVCRSLDGQVFVTGKGPQPPIHVNCRSFTIPTWDDLDPRQGTTRASKGDEDGQQVPATLTYYEWLLQQPYEFQVDAIGRTRAALLRDGGLSAAQFAALNLDKNFAPLSLDEMRKKNPAAFERAGIKPPTPKED